jgi:hypothetical protein
VKGGLNNFGQDCLWEDLDLMKSNSETEMIVYSASAKLVPVINIVTVRAWKIRRTDHVARIRGVTVT